MTQDLLALDNRTRYVSAYSRVPRVKDIFPPAAVVEKHGGGIMLMTIFSCGCAVKEFSNGVSVRAGCPTHGDAIRLKCPIDSCGKTFAKKIDQKFHRREAHRN